MHEFFIHNRKYRWAFVTIFENYCIIMVSRKFSHRLSMVFVSLVFLSVSFPLLFPLLRLFFSCFDSFLTSAGLQLIIIVNKTVFMITFSFLNQSLWCDPHWYCLFETIPRSCHTIGFGWEIRKFAFWKLSILGLIYCPASVFELLLLVSSSLTLDCSLRFLFFCSESLSTSDILSWSVYFWMHPAWRVANMLMYFLLSLAILMYLMRLGDYC